jgi:purine-binding chemotaxis protein CheW
VSLSGIMKWPDEITPIPGYAEWFLGLVSTRGRQVKVIDLARFVIPENHKSRQVLSGERQFKHLLLLEGGRMGLACDELGTVLKVAPDQVRWRSDTSVRPWLAGTLIEQMSALLDVEQLTAILKEGAPLDDIT